MHDLTLADKVLWAEGFIQNLVLLLVLLYKHRNRSVPWFTALIAFGTVRTITLFVVRQVSIGHYAKVYWWAAGIDFVLQLGVVFEIARQVFVRKGKWVAEARRRFLFIAAAAPILGVVLAMTMKPAAETAMRAWDARASLFMTTMICVMCGAIATASEELGLGWRTRLTRFVLGLTTWSLASFVTGTLHFYWRTIDHFGVLENIIAVVYSLVTIYWIVIFWLPEPEPVPVPERAVMDIERLRERIRYGS